MTTLPTQHGAQPAPPARHAPRSSSKLGLSAASLLAAFVGGEVVARRTGLADLGLLE